MAPRRRVPGDRGGGGAGELASYQTAADIAARDAFNGRLVVGALVYVLDTGHGDPGYYRYGGGSSWSVVTFGAQLGAADPVTSGGVASPGASGSASKQDHRHPVCLLLASPGDLPDPTNPANKYYFAVTTDDGTLWFSMGNTWVPVAGVS